MDLTDKIRLTNEDNMVMMGRYPDNHFDLAIVDPPYGQGNNYNFRYNDKHKYENTSTPESMYFSELFRISKNQVVWAGNYFTNNLPVSRGWICWDKVQTESGYFSHFELGWTSFDQVSKFFRIANAGFNHGDLRSGEPSTIHPTQKPVKLYEKVLMEFAKEGDKILDTHAGSFSIGIACNNLGFDLTACELDKDYFEASIKRFKEVTAQTQLFKPQSK